MTKPFPTKNLRFFLTAPSPCPYLPGRKERKVFTALDGFEAGVLHDALTNAGFRRSQNIAYRPSCDACDACISACVLVEQFIFNRCWRKIMLCNVDLICSLKLAQATEEQFRLLRCYLASRYAEGGMVEMIFIDYVVMVEEFVVYM